MAILLIRHGETAGNRNRIIQVPETPLSEHGLEQASRLGRRLAREPIHEIWTSHLPRARMTADAVHKTTGAALLEVPDLEERNLGALRGRAYADLGFNPFDPGYEPPEGESWEDFYRRVDRTWEEIERHWVDQYSKPGDERHFAIVSHGLFLRSLIERLLLSEEELARFGDENRQIVMPNTALSVVASTPSDSGRPIHRLELIGCIRHLDEATANDDEAIVGI
jgi:broad specificity phosphatase PhoE